MNGNILGNTVQLSDVVVTRAKSSHMTGRVSLRALDLGLLERILQPPKDEPEGVTAAPVAALGGQLWGELVVDDVPLDAPARSSARLVIGPTFVSRAGRKITLKPPREPLVLANDSLTIPPLEMTLDTDTREDQDAASGERGFHGGFVLTGTVTKVSTDPIARSRREARSGRPGGPAAPRAEGGSRERSRRGERTCDRQEPPRRRSSASCTRRGTTSRFTAFRAP